MESYYQRNKETIKQKARERYSLCKEQILQQKKEYYKCNAEAKRAYQNEYYKNPENIKNNTINSWKRQGIISENYDELYNTYINTNECELCKTAITGGKGLNGKRHLDHDHTTGEFRNILCGKCNIHLK